MSERIKVGVVGTGYLGRLHTRVLTEIADAEVIGFVEPNDAVAAEISATLGRRRFPDRRGPGCCHRLRCRGHADGFPLRGRFRTARRRSRRDDRETDHGDDLGCATSHRLSREEREESSRWDTWSDTTRPSWPLPPCSKSPRFVEAQRLGVFAARSLDIDVLLDLMIHDLNLVLSLLGREVERVDAVGVPVLTDKVDIANVRLVLDNGAVANLTASRVSSERVRKIRFFGNDSYISVDTKEQDVKGYRLVEGTDGTLHSAHRDRS